MKRFRYLALLIAVFYSIQSEAQSDTAAYKTSIIIDSANQRDVIDLLVKFFDKNVTADKRKNAGKLSFAALPAVGYSLSTGFGAGLLSNVAFHTSTSHQENLSEISATMYIDTKTQKVVESRSEVWFAKNDYKLVSDLRFESYPEDTYGLGTFTTDATINHLDYLYLRTYATLYRKILPGYFFGLGYALDHHYNITAAGNADKSISDFAKYGQTGTSTSSGTTLNLLFDNRQNPINPLNGAYAHITLRNNFTVVGSDNNWSQLAIDLRKYFRTSPGSNNNVLAFWTIMAFTSGNIPYLDMPATAVDMYNNSGRGYKQDRFRGKNELYFEGEYRFGITKNGLIGGVVFANAQSFSELNTNQFARFAPAAGTGIRMKINKHSNTNAAIDYAYGVGSHGFFAGLGEVF